MGSAGEGVSCPSERDGTGSGGEGGSSFRSAAVGAAFGVAGCTSPSDPGVSNNEGFDANRGFVSAKGGASGVLGVYPLDWLYADGSVCKDFGPEGAREIVSGCFLSFSILRSEAAGTGGRLGASGGREDASV